MSILIQVGCTGLICFLCLSVGVMYAWPSSTFNKFSSETDTPLHRAMTGGELSLFGSLSSIGALVSTPLAGFSLDRLGRKNTALIFALVTVVSWSMIAVSNRVEVVLSAMFVAGLSGAAILVVPVYVSEICQESVRGAMTSGSLVFYGLGMLVSYLMGGYLEYRPMIYVCLSISVVGALAISLLRDSPTCLMVKGLEEEAAKAMAFYRGCKPTDKAVQEELNMIRRALNPVMDDATPEEEKQLNVDSRPKEKISIIQFLKKSSSTRRALLVNLVLATAAIFQGLAVVQVYAERLFQQAVPGVSATLCSVLLAVLGVVAGLVSAYLTDLAGRRPLMIFASLAAGASCAALGSLVQLRWGPGWLTALLIYLYSFCYTCGAGTVPFVLLAELFLPEIKSFATMLIVEWVWLCNSIVLYMFNPLLKAIGLGPVFYIFAGMCFLTAVFAAVFQPETKGLPVDVIQTLFTKKRRDQPKLY